MERIRRRDDAFNRSGPSDKIDGPSGDMSHL